MIKIKCNICGEIVETYPCNINKKYCSKKCLGIANGIKLKNKSRTLITKQKISKANKGEKNGMWKGDDVGYLSLHEWIIHYKPKPILCEKCKNRKAFDCANISGKYKRDINDFKWLCRKCHMEEDGRLNKFKLLHKRK